MATTAKKIYRGIDPEKQTHSNRTCVGAYLPGTFCTMSATQFTQATVGTGRNVLLAPMKAQGQAVATAYAAGDTAVAYDVLPGEPFCARFAAATYTYGQELTIAASGRLAAAASTNVVVGFYTGSGVALSAGDLDDFVGANFYIKP